MKRLLVSLVALVLVGCGIIPTPAEPSTTAAFPQRSIDLGIGVELTIVGEDSAVEPADDGDCGGTVHRLTTSTGSYQLTVLGTECTNDPKALNGFHGYFVSPPQGAEVSTATTPIGPAQLFSHKYEECTNSCGFGTDEVALVAVDGRTVQVIAVAQVGGPARTRDRAQLVSLLQGLRKV